MEAKSHLMQYFEFVSGIVYYKVTEILKQFFIMRFSFLNKMLF